MLYVPGTACGLFLWFFTLTILPSHTLPNPTPPSRPHNRKRHSPTLSQQRLAVIAAENGLLLQITHQAPVALA